ncbi:hypothetical protein [Methanococcus aeolicus]|nr:hypothetical protein [Methanococcus aeolicus]UXM85059.1 hypothetical protein N6C89_01900 [Methanococcus aeolicus]
MKKLTIEVLENFWALRKKSGIIYAKKGAPQNTKLSQSSKTVPNPSQRIL